MSDNDITHVINKINMLGPTIVKNVTTAINKEIEDVGDLDHYDIVWKQLQTIAIKQIKLILQNNFAGCKIPTLKSKSTYPDIKMEYQGGVFAIDMKSNECQKNPWFDMTRLDTIMIERRESFDEEWELVIKYDSQTKRFLKAYFNLFREVVGIREECNGVKYRPYDGKIRPKSWDDFENNNIYWANKKDFLRGIRNSIIHRWKENIANILILLLTDDEKAAFKKLFD
jgi:hypothetical protein